jgi:hypothetical protein
MAQIGCTPFDYANLAHRETAACELRKWARLASSADQLGTLRAVFHAGGGGLTGFCGRCANVMRQVEAQTPEVT